MFSDRKLLQLNLYVDIFRTIFCFDSVIKMLLTYIAIDLIYLRKLSISNIADSNSIEKYDTIQRSSPMIYKIEVKVWIFSTIATILYILIIALSSNLVFDSLKKARLNGQGNGVMVMGEM